MEQLVAHTRVAAAKGLKFVFAKKDVMDIFTIGSPDPKPYFSMSGLMVVEEGKLEEAEKDFNRTVEQYNHGSY